MALPVLGARATGDRLARMQRSPNWGKGHFQDAVPRGDTNLVTHLRRQVGWGAVVDWLFGGSKYRIPKQPIPVLERGPGEFDEPPGSGLRITWLGHSTILVELDGVRLLTDPVWGDFIGPTRAMGQRRFFPPPLPFDALPPVDVVVLSHDHYDHLDYPTIRRLAPTGTRFVAPLGVGAHLEAWGIAPERITELDWWEEAQIADLTFVATPARHFSGRAVRDLERTLWAGFAIRGPRHRVYYSGDTAMFPGLSEIGERLGPFDATLIEAGAYSCHWADVHLGPEQAVQAHRMVRGELMVPVHWALFDLAMHGWTEPVERVLLAARARGIRVATPRPGESFEPAVALPDGGWWPEVPWETAEQAPVVSTGPDGSPLPPLDSGELPEP